MAREVACGYADNACRALDAIPSSEYSAALRTLAAVIAHRTV